MNIRKSLNTTFNRLFQVINRSCLRKIDHSLYVCEQVLAAVFCLPRQRSDLLLASLLFGNVPGDLRRSDDLPLRVFDRRNRQRNRNEAAVLTLPDRLKMVDPLATPDAV